MSDELERVASLIKENKDSEAREILLKLLESNPGNDEALVWLASITPDRTKRQQYLEEALQNNPRNQVAQRTLQKMTAPVETRSSQAQAQTLPPVVHILCGWPLILVFFGGAIGGALGGVAYAANLAVFKSNMPGALKFVLNPIIGIAAIGLWFVIVMAIAR